MKIEIKFRGLRTDGKGWVEGDLVHDAFDGHSGDVSVGIRKRNCYPVDVIPETVGQLRHVNEHGKYFDGDIYYHSWYGDETVSDLCELQWALLTGHADDIGPIKGNIHEPCSKPNA